MNIFWRTLAIGLIPCLLLQSIPAAQMPIASFDGEATGIFQNQALGEQIVFATTGDVGRIPCADVKKKVGARSEISHNPVIGNPRAVPEKLMSIAAILFIFLFHWAAFMWAQDPQLLTELQVKNFVERLDIGKTYADAVKGFHQLGPDAQDQVIMGLVKYGLDEDDHAQRVNARKTIIALNSPDYTLYALDSQFKNRTSPRLVDETIRVMFRLRWDRGITMLREILGESGRDDIEFIQQLYSFGSQQENFKGIGGGDHLQDGSNDRRKLDDQAREFLKRHPKGSLSKNDPHADLYVIFYQLAQLALNSTAMTQNEFIKDRNAIVEEADTVTSAPNLPFKLQLPVPFGMIMIWETREKSAPLVNAAA